jgi:ATP adenylyltransferase
MDRIWSPWRYTYVSEASQSDACIFCEKASQDQDASNYVVYRGKQNFVLLNLYPYTTGHLMIAPYEHVATLGEVKPGALVEMIELAQASERHLREIYRPPGLNIGMNIGECAGAGVAGHVHMHVLPRWPGDSSFMTTVGETRVLPEAIETTYAKLLRAFRG